MVQEQACQIDQASQTFDACYTIVIQPESAEVLVGVKTLNPVEPYDCSYIKTFVV
jgi:hypothetical protein